MDVGSEEEEKMSQKQLERHRTTQPILVPNLPSPQTEAICHLHAHPRYQNNPKELLYPMTVISGTEKH